MNGGRLSNDETFRLGAAELRTQLDAPRPDADAAARALARIGVRYPEEAERLGQLWPGQPALCAELLLQVESRHRAEEDE